MAIPGPTVHQQLMDAYTRLTEQLEADRKNMQDVRDEHQQLDAQRDVALRSLAEHYLPELTADAIASTWKEVQDAISVILLQKEDEARNLQAELTQLHSNRIVSEEALMKSTDLLDAAVKSQSEVSAQVEGQLQDDSKFVELSDRAAIAEAALERAESNLHEIDQDAVRKLPAYEASALFQYLYDSGYGGRQYKRRGLTRRIDRWLARYINFNQATQGYNFLKQTPDQMRKIIADDRRSLGVVMEELERKRDHVANEWGLPEKLKETEELTRQRVQNLQTLDSIMESAEAAERRVTDIENPRGSHYCKAIELFRQTLQQFTTSDLKRRASETFEDISDDQIVARLSGVESDRGDLEQATRRRRDALQQQRKVLEELGRVIQRFRAAHFDSTRSQFLDSFNIEQELEYTEDAEDARKLWQRIRRAQRWGDHESEEDSSGSSLKQVLVNAMAQAADSDHEDQARRAGSRRTPYDSKSDANRGGSDSWDGDSR